MIITMTLVAITASICFFIIYRKHEALKKQVEKTPSEIERLKFYIANIEGIKTQMKDDIESLKQYKKIVDALIPMLEIKEVDRKDWYKNMYKDIAGTIKSNLKS